MQISVSNELLLLLPPMARLFIWFRKNWITQSQLPFGTSGLPSLRPSQFLTVGESLSILNNGLHYIALDPFSNTLA